MTLSAPQRFRVVENHDESGLIHHIAMRSGFSHVEVLALLTKAGTRLAEILSFAHRPPIIISAHGTVRIEGIAGLVRLAPQVELEVVPKFLDGVDIQWQEDFFVLALFSQTGRMLPREHLRAGYADRGDLATLVGRTMAQMYWATHRRPLRVYRRQYLEEFALDGDVEPVGLVLPESGGFPQTRILLHRSNHYNSVIASAAKALLPEVRDSETRYQLLRLYEALAPQQPVRRARHAVLPSRHRRWQQLYDLSVEVLNGFGLGYQPAGLFAPGYVLKTWTTWESLCEAGLRAGLVGTDVHSKVRYRLGMRGTEAMVVTPDAVVGSRSAQRCLVDAKYRTRSGKKPAVDAGDVYEALAFMRAAHSTRTVLLYPRPASDGASLDVGTATLFETIVVGQERIEAFTVECRGISKAGGFAAFCRGLVCAVSHPSLALAQGDTTAC